MKGISSFYVQMLVLVLMNLSLATNDSASQNVRTFNQIQFQNWLNTQSSLILSPSSEMNGMFKIYLPPALPSEGHVLFAEDITGNELKLGWLNPSSLGAGWGMSGNSGLTNWNGATGNYLGASDASSLFFVTKQNSSIYFWTSNTERMKLTGSGNLVIGASAEIEKLNVGGALAFKSLSANPSQTAGYGKLFARDADSTVCVMSPNGSIIQLTRQFVVLEEITNYDVNAGLLDKNVWTVRKINHTEFSMGDFCTLDSTNGKFTLKTGLYKINAFTLVYSARGFVSRLYSYTDSKALLYSTTGLADDITTVLGVTTPAVILGFVNLSNSTTLSLDVNTPTGDQYGLGKAHLVNPVKNKYSLIMIEKIN